LLPQIRLEDFGRREESKNRDVTCGDRKIVAIGFLREHRGGLRAQLGAKRGRA
jgi:hypothetical protein